MEVQPQVRNPLVFVLFKNCVIFKMNVINRPYSCLASIVVHFMLVLIVPQGNKICF